MTRTTVRAVLALACAAAAASPLAALAAPADGPLMVRLRAVHLDSANGDSTGLGLSINNKWLPDLDVSYFFTPSIATELVLTYPQKQTVRSNGAEIGSLKHLPPTLTLQYHFNPGGSFQPYAGAGLNYTRFSQVRFTPAVQAALRPSLEKNSVGLAVQLGADIALGDGLYLNVDAKKVQIRTDVSSAGARVGEFRVDPVLFGIGIGKRF